MPFNSNVLVEVTEPIGTVLSPTVNTSNSVLLVAEFDNIAKLVQVEYINTSGSTAVISQAKLVY